MTKVSRTSKKRAGKSAGDAAGSLTLPAGRAARSPCPIGQGLEIIGDKWTLLIVRDMLMMGTRTYKEFQAAPESIPTNTLASRLKMLEETGLMSKTLYQSNPDRYEYSLTEKGARLRPVLEAIRVWTAEEMDH